MKVTALFRAVLIFSFLGLANCTTISQVRPDFTNSPEERAFKAITVQMDTGHYGEAVLAADEFQNKYPYSLMLQKVRFQKGLALEGLQRWEDAAETYIAISNFSKKTQPEIAAQSVYRLSFVYEALNDNQRVLTSLFDAQRLEQYLPAEVSMAEIPARLAAAYMKENNPEESKRWLEEAEDGLKRAMESSSEPITTEWLARTHYNMGVVTAGTLNLDNVLMVIQSQRATQKYLLKSLQYNDPVWSAKAAKQVHATFDAILHAIEEQPTEKGLDPQASTKQKKDQQFKLAGPFADLINEAVLYEPGPDQISNTYQTDAYTYLKALKVKVQGILQSPNYTPLIRRNDKASPKKPVPDTILKSEDPNL